MTPLIQEFVAAGPLDVVDHHWFDMTSVYRREQEINGEVLSRPLPYPKTALVCEYEGKKILLFIVRTGEITGVVGLQRVGQRTQDVPAFMYIVEAEVVKVSHKDGSPFDYRTSYATGALAFVAAFLESLDAGPVVGYQPVRRANWAKKLRQGKPPTYDWTTVTIEPPTPKADPQGGTHAPPRWHERRGHWRNTKAGKRVWVRNCEVGDKARGAVFHDYKINPAG
jgi:hypothetical protein